MADNLEELEKENKYLKENVTLKKEAEKYDDRKKKNNKSFSKDRKEAQAALRNMRDMMNDLGINSERLYRTTTDYFKAWVNFKSFESFSSMTKDLVSSNNEFHRLIVNAGSANISLKDATTNLNNLQVELGASFEDAKNVVTTLATKQYVGNLKEAAEGAYSLARATGIDKAEAASFTVEFQKTGKLATQTINGIYADLLKIQQTNGLTKEGVQAVSQQLIKTAGNMRAFGQSETQIRKMAAGTIQLVSGLEKVGISAQKATGFIDKLLDPEKIEENIGLYSQLGISISDAISGNIDSTQMQNGLKDFGEKVKAMGPIAGSAYAKAFGVSFNDAVKAADLDGATQMDMTPEEKSLEAIKELTENTKTSSEKMSDSMNKLIGKIMRLGPVVTTVMGIIGTLIANQIEKAIDRGYREGNKTVEEGAEENLKNAEKIINLEAQMRKKSITDRKKFAADANSEEFHKRTADLQEEYNEKVTLYKKSKELHDASEEKMKDLREELLKETNEEKRKGIIENINLEEKNSQRELENLAKYSAKANEIRDKLKDVIDVNNLKIKIQAETEVSADNDLKTVGERLEDFGRNGGELIGRNAAESFKNGLQKVKNFVKRPKGESSIKKEAGPIKKLFKGIGNGIAGSFKVAGGFVSELFRKSGKENAEDIEEANKKDKGESKLGKVAGVFGKVALIGGVIVGLLSPLIAAIKDMDSVKGIMKIFTDCMKDVATKLSPVIDTLAAVGQQILRSITGVLGRVFELVAKLLKQLAPTLAIIGDVLSELFNSLGDILETALPIIANILEAVMPVIAIALGALNLLLKPINVVLKIIAKAIELITAPIRWLAQKFGGGQEKLQNATDALEKNTDTLEKSNEPKPEQITAGADGSIYTSGVGGTVTTSTSSSAATGATKTNSTTQVEKSSTPSSLENKIDELNGTVKQLVDIENKKMGNGEVASTIGDRFKESLGILKNGAPLRVSITELSTLAALQMQGGIIGLAASTIQIGKNLLSGVSASDVNSDQPG